jgi:diaminobutyrate-2-oxoglutarate transaminase
VQAEGGINTASFEWLQRLAELCRTYDMLLIVDDVQAGCGRTGPFFSFEPAGIVPDIVCLSKSLSGFGLPMAITLFRPDLDIWSPGEHSGTFRGNNPAFVTAKVALERYWGTDDLSNAVEAKGETVASCLDELATAYPEARGRMRGRGMLRGLFCDVPGLAEEVCKVAFQRGLIMETSGPQSDVIKVMPPLVIDNETLSTGLDILGESFATVVGERNLSTGPEFISVGP